VRIVDTPDVALPGAAIPCPAKSLENPMSLFKTEMLWLHPPRYPPRPARYGHLRRRDAAAATHRAAATQDAIDTHDMHVEACLNDEALRAPLDRAA
jgi:hypothetical protein